MKTFPGLRNEWKLKRIPISQVEPVYPLRHVHLNPLEASSVHCPLFLQGLFKIHCNSSNRKSKILNLKYSYFVYRVKYLIHNLFLYIHWNKYRNNHHRPHRHIFRHSSKDLTFHHRLKLLNLIDDNIIICNRDIQRFHHTHDNSPQKDNQRFSKFTLT